MHTSVFLSDDIFVPVFALALGLVTTFLVTGLLCRFAPFLHLEDMPDERKRHKGKIPMVGGLSIFAGFFAGCLPVPHLIGLLDVPLFFGFLILILGALDDACNIRPGVRLFAQIVITLLFIYFSGMRLVSFGDLFFGRALEVSVLSGLFTLLAFCAGINAFNMIDGIDGLAAFMGLAVLLPLAWLFSPNLPLYSFVCLLFAVSLLVFFCMNLRLFSPRRKIFLGDAGSMFLGFMVAFLLIRASQGWGPGRGSMTVIRPITCVWFIAVPIMDMVGIMLRRILRAQSPLRGDLNHLHHLLIDMGFPPRKVLGIMGAMAVFFSGTGLLGEAYKIPEGWMFFSFLFFFALYSLLIFVLTRHIAQRHSRSARK